MVSIDFEVNFLQFFKTMKKINSNNQHCIPVGNSEEGNKRYHPIDPTYVRYSGRCKNSTT